jgi:GUN4-like
VCLYAACRINEACTLAVKDVFGSSGVRGVLVLRSVNSKGKRDTREIQVHLTQLEQLLKLGKWKEANTKTHTIICEILNKINNASFKNYSDWLSPEDFKNFPCEHLNKIDDFWIKYSNIKFGFSVQKDIYLNAGGKLDCTSQISWEEPAVKAASKFQSNIGWEDLDNPNIKFNDLDNAPKGYLPYWYKEMGRSGGFVGLFCRIETCKTCSDKTLDVNETA